MIISIDDINTEELMPYHKLSERELSHINEPDAGILKPFADQRNYYQELLDLN